MKNFITMLFVVGFSGAAFYFSNGFHDIWWLMWIAPIPVLVYATHQSVSKTLCVAFLVGLANGLNGIIGYWHTLIPASSFILSACIQSLEWTLIILLTRFFMRSISSPFSIFAYPTCLALAEWLESLSMQGTFDTIAYSQLKVLPVIQTASLAGYVGVSFILALFAASIAYSICYWQEKKKALTGLALGLFVVAAALIYGLCRLHSFSENTPQTTLKVGLASVSYAPKKIFNPQFAPEIFRAYQPLMQSLAQHSADFILLPEEAFTVTQKTQEKYKVWFSAFAKQYHLKLIVGVQEKDQKNTYNAAWLFDKNGEWLGEYHKRHFVPGVEEGLTPGQALLSFEENKNQAGIAICRDMDYPDPAEDYGYLGTQILFVPAWDFDVDAKVHASGAWMRGIENGYTLVRSARDGFLSVSDPTGKILAITPAMSAKGTYLLASVPIYENQSFYTKHHLWFIITLCLILATLICMALVR